ncbi:hypothetical protein ILUMI_14754 [Ignelater luminosus]|uniref:PiggyBac transposable element-derived protein domain-containing protein n=1 Tax=Ignelater luminosus TaxID=2038154 RepID=A0A8K0G9R5_IGNLU|nr:hypothetical protein ILUMI_14754 [Ignelater luminosus]
MAKQKYLTNDEPREILEESDNSDGVHDFSSENSVQDPAWSPSESLSTDDDESVGQRRAVCLKLAKNLLNEGRRLYIDNFYKSYELGLSLLDKKTHTIGTLRSNKKYMPYEIINAKLKNKGDLIAREDKNGIVVLKWLDTCKVRMLSTKHSPNLSSSEARNNEPSTSKGRKRQIKNKPKAVKAYYKGKAGIDLSDLCYNIKKRSQMVEEACNGVSFGNIPCQCICDL